MDTGNGLLAPARSSLEWAMKACVPVLAFALLTGCSERDGSGCAHVTDNLLGHKLTEIAGRDARDCGLVPLKGDASFVLACAREMLAERTPFLAVVQLKGIDSVIYEVVAAGAEGQLALVLYDSNIGCGNAYVKVTRCSRVAMNGKADRPFVCSTA